MGNVSRVVRACCLLFLSTLAASCDEARRNGEDKPHRSIAALAQDRPKIALTGRVTDAAEILSAAQEESLAQQLERLERTTRHQMVVVTVPSLGGEDIAAFTRKLGDAWGIGRAEEDDGVILLIAPNERQARIAVGYGLESKLPDSLCQQIMDRHIIPRFEQGDLPGGIGAGVKAIIAHLQRR